MKKLILLALFAQVMAAQTVTTTLTGTIKDLAGNTVTSGRILFTSSLKSGQDSTIPGTARFVPSTVTCLINASGNPVASPGGTAPCVITKNTAMSPAGTSYVVNIQPYNVSPGAIFNFYAILDTVDISTIAPTPSQLPTNYAGTQGPPGIPGCVASGSITCVTSPQIRYASQLGCASLNVNLNTGLRFDGGAAHDDGPCIDAALSAATAQSGIILVIDGAALVSGIHGPKNGNWGIIGLGGGFLSDGTTLYGTGFFQKAGSNDDVIHNGGVGAGCVVGTDGQRHSDPGWPGATPGAAPARGANLIFRDFVINGNRGNGSNGNSNSGTPQGIGVYTDIYGAPYCWYTGINIMDMNNVEVSGVTFYNTSAYNLRLSNVGEWDVHKNVFANMGLHPGTYIAQNGDGLHVNGPSENGHEYTNTYSTTDDAIALNSPEGWGGLINNISISGSTVIQAAALLRIYTGSIAVPAGDAAPLVYNVSITNYSGQSPIFCGLFGLDSARTLTRTSTISNVKWSNSTCTSRYAMTMGDNVGTIEFSNFQWHNGGSNGFISQGTLASAINYLNLDNITISRSAGFAGATALVDAISSPFGSGGALNIARTNITGVNVVDAVGFTGATINQAMAALSPSSFGIIQATGVDFAHFGKLVNVTAPVTSVAPNVDYSGPSDTARIAASFNANQTISSNQNFSDTVPHIWDWMNLGNAGGQISGAMCFGDYTTDPTARVVPMCIGNAIFTLLRGVAFGFSSNPKATTPDVSIFSPSSGALGFSPLVGTGDRAVCAHANGTIYASTTTTCP